MYPDLIDATYKVVISIINAHPNSFDFLEHMPYRHDENFFTDMGIKSGIRSSLKGAQIDRGAIGEFRKMQAIVACYHAGLAEIERFGQSSREGRVLENELFAKLKEELENF